MDLRAVCKLFRGAVIRTQLLEGTQPGRRRGRGPVWAAGGMSKPRSTGGRREPAELRASGRRVARCTELASRKGPRVTQRAPRGTFGFARAAKDPLRDRGFMAKLTTTDPGDRKSVV